MSPDWLYVYTDWNQSGNSFPTWKGGVSFEADALLLFLPQVEEKWVMSQAREGPTREATISVCCSGNLVTLALWAAMISIRSSPAVTARSSRIFIGHLISDSGCQLSSKSVPGCSCLWGLSVCFFFISGCHFDDRWSPPTLWMSFHSPVLSGCFDRHLEMCCLVAASLQGGHPP